MIMMIKMKINLKMREKRLSEAKKIIKKNHFSNKKMKVFRILKKANLIQMKINYNEAKQ